MNGKTDRQLLIEKITDAIKKCDKHTLRIEEALNELNGLLPLNVDTYRKIDADKIRAIDQLLFRFGKLQDEIGSTVIKSICDLLENTRQNTTFIDYLNIAEKYEILESVHSWEIVRTIRNSITYDYEEDEEYQVKTINNVYDGYKEVLKVINNIKNKFEEIRKSNT